MIGRGIVEVNPPLPWEVGDEVTLTATPAATWEFEAWGGAAEGTEAQVVLALDGVTSVTASFLRPGTATYWAWRDRLLEEFVSVGGGPGQSVPAEWFMESSGIIAWADGTMHHGFYLGVLATECAMLADPETWPRFGEGRDDPLGACQSELRDALAALQRLDGVAEESFVPGFPDQPGFFIRDDAPADMHLQFPGMTVSASDFLSLNLTDKEMSQDQVVHLLQGLSLVKALVEPGTVVDGMDLVEFAVERVTEIVQWVEDDSWIIRNPAPTPHAVARGSDANGFSPGFSQALMYVTDGAVDLSPTVNPLWGAAYDTLSNPANPVYVNVDNLHMASVLISVGRSFGDDTLAVLVDIGASEEFVLFPLEHVLLYDGLEPLPDQEAQVEALTAIVNGWIATAPMTGARYPLADPAECALGWCASNKFIRGVDGAYGGSGDNAGRDFNGLDFLLVHNASALAGPDFF